jgi:hypothetical protein
MGNGLDPTFRAGVARAAGLGLIHKQNQLQVERSMSSSLPLALAVLLGASGAASAAEQPGPGGPEVSGRAMPEADAPALNAAKLVDYEAVVTGGASHLRPRSAGQRPLPFVELRLGRTPAFGHSPAAPPPTFGEVGIDIDPRSSVALVPSYRVILDDDDAQGDGSFAAQILKLGVRMRF